MKTIYLIAIIFLTIFLGFSTGQLVQTAYISKIIDQLYQSTQSIEIINFSTNSDVYSSNQQMKINVVIDASDDIENTTVRVYGVPARNGYRIDQTKTLNLSAGENVVEFSSSTPSCYGCSGISPGSYNLTTIVSCDLDIVNDTHEIEIRR